MLWLEIPAYAGSTSPAPAGQGPAPDHPRIRGEHLHRKVPHREGLGSSPHTRGARGNLGQWSRREGIIPAYAGSTSVGDLAPYILPDHPRIRGEHMSIGFRPDPDGGSSPHTRGARCPARRPCMPGRIIPAYAGSTSVPGGFPPCCTDHPRIRGEHGSAGGWGACSIGSSPHTRGARRAACR